MKEKKKTILIAEDDFVSYRLLSILVSKKGAKVLWAKNGLEAVELCSHNKKICLVFMDVNMPIMNGYNATIKIKKMRKELPVVILTAYGDNKNESCETGCDDYIIKPFNMKIVFDIMNKYIEEYNH